MIECGEHDKKLKIVAMSSIEFLAQLLHLYSRERARTTISSLWRYNNCIVSLDDGNFAHITCNLRRADDNRCRQSNPKEQCIDQQSPHISRSVCHEGHSFLTIRIVGLCRLRWLRSPTPFVPAKIESQRL